MVIEVGKFAKVINDDGLTEHGIHTGDHVFLTASGFVPDSKDDPYLYRLTFVAARLDKDNHIQLDQGFTIAGVSIRAATKAKEAKLSAIKDIDFAPTDEQLAAGAAQAQ